MPFLLLSSCRDGGALQASKAPPSQQLSVPWNLGERKPHWLGWKPLDLQGWLGVGRWAVRVTGAGGQRPE